MNTRHLRFFIYFSLECIL